MAKKTATHKVTLTESEQFFYEYAGYSYDPEKESTVSGKVRTAILLANAEKTAVSKGWEIWWEIDPDADITPTDNYFVSGAPQWEAVLYGPDKDYPESCVDTNNPLASLCGIDFGYDDNGYPIEPSDNPPYKRVVEAELASEAIG